MESSHHQLDELLKVEQLPSLKEGDTVQFENGDVQDVYHLALVMIDALEAAHLPLLKNDSRLLEKRINKGFVTGLQLQSAELVEYGNFALKTTAKTNTAFGSLFIVRGEHVYPGFGRTPLEFPFVVLKTERFCRFGPYDEAKQTIGEIESATAEKAAKLAKNAGAFAMQGMASKKGARKSHIVGHE